MVVLLRIKNCFIDNLDNFAPRDLDIPSCSKDYKSMATKIQKIFLNSLVTLSNDFIDN
jgi:hypothetical protein